MAQVRRVTSTKRFGTRYGRSLKDKLAPIEESSRKTYECPYCSKIGVRRQAAGIWFCKKCGAKFASKAYTISKKKAIKEEFKDLSPVEETQELPDEIVAIAQNDDSDLDDSKEVVDSEEPIKETTEEVETEELVEETEEPVEETEESDKKEE